MITTVEKLIRELEEFDGKTELWIEIMDEDLFRHPVDVLTNDDGSVRITV